MLQKNQQNQIKVTYLQYAVDGNVSAGSHILHQDISRDLHCNEVELCFLLGERCLIISTYLQLWSHHGFNRRASNCNHGVPISSQHSSHLLINGSEGPQKSLAFTTPFRNLLLLNKLDLLMYCDSLFVITAVHLQVIICSCLRYSTIICCELP
jgi:hypothetical protein